MGLNYAMSRTSRLVLEAELETAARLNYLLGKLSNEMSQYQYIAVLVEASALLARLHDVPTDQVYKFLSSQDRRLLPSAATQLLEKLPSRQFLAAA